MYPKIKHMRLRSKIKIRKEWVIDLLMFTILAAALVLLAIII
jgi:hypothetical protein